MDKTVGKFDKLYEILSKVSTLDPGTEKERRLKTPELVEYHGYPCNRVSCHLAGCYGWLFQFSYDTKQDKYFFIADHSEKVYYIGEKEVGSDHSYNFPSDLFPNSAFYFSITDLGEEEAIRRIKDIITWIRLNKEEAFVFSIFPSAFIKDEEWKIPRFRLDCNPDLLNPKNLSLYNFLIRQMRLGSVKHLERVRKDSICQDIYRHYRQIKRELNQHYNEAINVARKEYPMDILKFLPMFRAVVIDEKAKVHLYISRISLKKVDDDIFKLALEHHTYEDFLSHLLDDKFDADRVINRIDYIYSKNNEAYNRIMHITDCERFTFPFLINNNIKPYYKLVDNYKIDIRPYDYLPSDINLYEEKSISYWTSINTDDIGMKFNYYEFNLKLGQDIHQFNAGDYRLASLMTWMEENYFNKEKGEDVK